MEILAIIPARKGSKGIKNKNIIPLCNHPLIAYSIAAAKKSKDITRVICSTNSKNISNIAIKYGAEVPFYRPENLSKDFILMVKKRVSILSGMKMDTRP